MNSYLVRITIRSVLGATAERQYDVMAPSPGAAIALAGKLARSEYIGITIEDARAEPNEENGPAPDEGDPKLRRG